MRLFVIALSLMASNAHAAIKMRELFWDAHSRRFALVLIDHQDDVRIFVGTRPVLHQVEVSDPEWFDERTELRVKIGTGQVVTFRNMRGRPVMFTQDPAALSLLYAEATARVQTRELEAGEIAKWVRQQSFRQSERWPRVNVDDERLRREFRVILHPLREVDLDFTETCEKTLVALNDNEPD